MSAVFQTYQKSNKAAVDKKKLQVEVAKFKINTLPSKHFFGNSFWYRDLLNWGVECVEKIII